MMNEIFRDLERYNTLKSNLYGAIKIVIFSHAFHLVFFIRLGQLLSRVPFFGALIRVIFEYVIRIIFSSDISLRAKFGEGLVIVHGHDIVIGADCILGKNCKILNGVTLGNKDTEIQHNCQPIVGNNVVIGTGAKILGRIKIGNNVYVGANSVVLKDVPNDCSVVGVPGVIKRRISSEISDNS